jgi:protein-tyrosine-phosphatase
MGKITLFVCAGNIFRSQMAKGFYNMYAKDGSRAESCGTKVAELGIAGKPIAELGLKATLDFMKSEGADISSEHSTPISKELIDNADRVIVMAEKETWPEYLKNNLKVTYWHVPDINVSTMEAVADTGNKIKNLVKELIKAS